MCAGSISGRKSAFVCNVSPAGPHGPLPASKALWGGTTETGQGRCCLRASLVTWQSLMSPARIFFHWCLWALIHPPLPPPGALLQQVCECGLGGSVSPSCRAALPCSRWLLPSENHHPLPLGSRSYSPSGDFEECIAGTWFPSCLSSDSWVWLSLLVLGWPREGWVFSFTEISMSHREPSSPGNLFKLSAIKQWTLERGSPNDGSYVNTETWPC